MVEDLGPGRGAGVEDWKCGRGRRYFRGGTTCAGGRRGYEGDADERHHQDAEEVNRAGGVIAYC